MLSFHSNSQRLRIVQNPKLYRLLQNVCILGSAFFASRLAEIGWGSHTA